MGVRRPTRNSVYVMSLVAEKGRRGKRNGITSDTLSASHVVTASQATQC